MRSVLMIGLLGISSLCLAYDAAEEQALIEEAQGHWAFEPIVRPAVPSVEHGELIRNPIDAFILSRLEAEGLSFSPPAGRHELLRRLSFDLVGLPPAPISIERFAHDQSSGAYARLVESLLSSAHYGEAWGRHWLDLVRFAETAGFNADPPRPLAYKYRDYVVRAFNEDKPYDRFIEEQLAGDEMYPDRQDALVATGYMLMWPDESNASDVLLARQDGLNDLTANVGQVFLGLSVGCAQCHDHKFDPISQRDFYTLQSFFTGIVRDDRVPVGSRSKLDAYREQLADWNNQTASLCRELHEIEQTAEAKASHVKRLKFPEIVLEAIDTRPDERTPYQRQLAFFSERQIDVKEKQLLGKMTKAQQVRRQELKQALKELQQERPKPPRWLDAMTAVETAAEAPPTFLLAGGSYRSPQDEVHPVFPTVLRGKWADAALDVEPGFATSGRRTLLTRWLTDRDHPLVARVMVNRIWQHHFGRGLVGDANDYGTQGAPPSHPELLDWLAAEFVEGGWSIKHMHRLIADSSVYRQSTYRRAADETPPPAAEVDPDNRLYWCRLRRRLSAEQIRDALLAAADQLNSQMYGPGVRPELPPNFSSRESWKVSEDVSQRNRRSVYIYAKRNLRYPLLEAFDFPDMHESCAARAQTTIAPQALMLLNSNLVLASAEAFARALLADQGDAQLESIVESAYLASLGRSPLAEEVEQGAEFIRRQVELVEASQADAEAENPTDSLATAVADFCHVLFNSNEFIYLE